MSRSYEFLLQDILTCIRKIETYISGLDRQAFLRDQKTLDAAIRNLEIIGEASRKMPADFKERQPDVPREGCAGARSAIR